MGVIDRAVLALKNFVGELARGQADVPLRLFPGVPRPVGAARQDRISRKRTSSFPI